MGIKLSIIVPVYNVEKYLPECIESILKQTVKDIEIICVNDGSTDQSLDILKQYKEKDERIVIIDQKNAGLGAARNVGINAAKGKYIGFVDSDDYIEETMFEKMLNSAELNLSDVVITNFYLYYSDTGLTSIYRDFIFYYQLEKKGYFTSIEHPQIIKNIGVWDKLYSKEFIDKFNLRNPENRIFEDALFTFQALTLASRISVVSEPLYYYRKNTGIAITDKEVKNDNYKFDFLKNSVEIKCFLTKNSFYFHYSKEFLEYQIFNAQWHNSNIRSFKNHKKFFNGMAQLLEEKDYEIINTSELQYKQKWYTDRLKKKQLIKTFIFYKVKRLIKRAI